MPGRFEKKKKGGGKVARFQLGISLDPELPMQRPALLSKIRAGFSFVCILSHECV